MRIAEVSVKTMALLTPEEFVTRTGWTVPIAVLVRELPETDAPGSTVWDGIHHALSLEDPKRAHWSLGPSGYDRTVMLRQRRQWMLLRAALRRDGLDRSVMVLEEAGADELLVRQARQRGLLAPELPVLRRAIAETLAEVVIDPQDLGDCWMVVRSEDA